MRWFDWPNSSYKILSKVIELEVLTLAYLQEQLPEQHKEPLVAAHESTLKQLNEIQKRCDDIRVSIFYSDGERFGLKYNEKTKEYFL